MIGPEQLQQLFPMENDVPPEHRPPDPIHQREWLVDGALKSWSGPSQMVLSPICMRRANGELAPIELGSYPQGGEAEAEAALAAAVGAYDNGRGIWPTMA